MKWEEGTWGGGVHMTVSGTVQNLKHIYVTVNDQVHKVFIFVSENLLLSLWCYFSKLTDV